MDASNWRIWFGILVLASFLILGIRGCLTRSENEGTTLVNIVLSAGDISQIRIADTTLVGHDTIYIGSNNVYQNRTGRDLVEYMVKYSTSGIDNGEPTGFIIGPNQYFFWYGDDESYRMFESPPSSTTFVTSGRSGMRNKIDFTYLKFLDFKENVSKSVYTPLFFNH